MTAGRIELGIAQSEVATISKWVAANASMMSGLAFVRAAEAAERARARPAPKHFSGAIPKYLERLRARRRRLGLDAAARTAPWNVSVERTVSVNHLGARYAIDLIEWDLYPGLRSSANLYRPLGRAGERFPVVLAPLACQTNLASHDVVQSVQRLCANLALYGFIVFAVADGLCFNGEIGERLENGAGFEQYGCLSGSGLGNDMLGLTVLTRALDYLVSRDDVDPERIATTGYSYGGGMSLRIAEVDPRVGAVGIVATSVATELRFTSGVFSYRRHAAIYSGAVELFVTSGTALSPFAEAEAEEEEETLPEPWSGLDDLALVAPRPFFILQGREDPGTSAAATKSAVERLSQLYVALGAEPRVSFHLVVGSHSYDEPRRRLVADWLIGELKPSPVLPPPIDELEHDTEIFPRSTLGPSRERTSSLRKIHVAAARAAIETHRPRVGFSTLPAGEARTRIRELLMMPAAPAPARPILVDDRAFTVGETGVIGSYWVLPLSDGIDAAAVTLRPDSGEVASRLMTIQLDGGVPEAFLARAATGDALIVVFPPGFGPLRSTQDKLGRFAVRLPNLIGRTLLGLGVEAAQRAVDLADAVFGRSPLMAEADGVDAGNIIAFAAVLDDRIAEATVTNGVSTFERFLTSATPALPAPTLAIPGIASYVDIGDLVRLALPRPLRVASESDLTEYVLDLRPKPQGS